MKKKKTSGQTSKRPDNTGDEQAATVAVVYETDLSRPFTQEDEAELARQLRIIKIKKENLRINLLDLALCFQIIKARQLHRKSGENFKVFIFKMTGFSGEWANQLIDAYESHKIVQRLGYAIAPITDLIPMRGMKPKQKEKAIKLAVKEAGDKPPKRKQIAAAADSIKRPVSKQRLAEIEKKLLTMRPGGACGGALQAQYEAEAAAILISLGITTTVDTGSPNEPTDVEAEDAWTEKHLARAHRIIDAWVVELDPDGKFKKLPAQIDRLKGMFTCP